MYQINLYIKINIFGHRLDWNECFKENYQIFLAMIKLKFMFQVKNYQSQNKSFFETEGQVPREYLGCVRAWERDLKTFALGDYQIKE